MANFAVAASQETIEKANYVMELYAQEGDKKEDTLLRILAMAENESVRGTHPALEGTLKSVDGTISTLIKQINGIVAGQDSQITELKENLDKALAEKQSAIETARAQMDAAQARTEAAEAAIKQAEADSELARTQAQGEIESTKKDADITIKQANNERDQAIRERDDARTISAEKTSSNDLLMRQMASMEADVQAHKELQDKYKQLSTDYYSVLAQLTEKEREIETQKKDAETAQNAIRSDYVQQMELSKAQADLALEKALNAQEKEIRSEYQDQIRQADKENAKLSAQIDQLQAQIDALIKNANNKK